MEKLLTRKDFLVQCGMLGAIAVLSPLVGKAHTLPDKKVKVGVIGCGSVSNMYLPHLSKCPYVEIVSCCDIVPERAKNQAEKYKIAKYYTHIDQQLAGVPFDLLVNLTDMQEHGRLNKQALLAGRHIWSEKPLANTYKEGKELVELAKKKKVRIWGAPAVVNSPQFAFMAKAIQDGKLGKVSAAHAHYGHLGPTWSAFFYEKGGGSLPDLGVYNLATLTGLLGPAKSVIAMTSIVTPLRKTDNKGEVKVEAEDNAMVIMEHDNGVLSHVQCGFNYFDPYGHEGKGQEKPSITIYGTHGNMHLIGYDWAPAGVDMATWENEKTVRFVPEAGNYVWEQGASVISESLATAQEPLITVEHALHVLEVIEAARTSQSTGKRIKLQSSFSYPLIK
ncbi:Gfo/Idh/MocA family protein [Thermoflexibacter ruber]|uniref:Predicted dehydrogenase n=1 Tax=Thermoflexibacter ruber TaxID=1003 RepID=A0A1I2BN08_9BACT|nr:Gfo/Idh/MocA family oxidoreductase [Thermoflexibacter ruber]SFE57562.1 Predicted dehydrogenase [Thermoflexibacter ruber]